MPRDAIELGAGFGTAEVFEPVAAVFDDRGYASDGFDVVDQRRFSTKTGFGRVGRFESRHASFAFERF